VQCASNLRQLFNLTQIYTNTYAGGYTMPSRSAPGSAQSNYWCGVDLLGPLMGVKRNDPSGAAQLDALGRIAKMLDCPAVMRIPDPSSSSPFVVDYTYNTNLGDDRAYDMPGSNANPQYVPWAFFKKRTQVPGNVLVAVDATDFIAQDDERFGSLKDLTTTSGTARLYPRAGHPHNNKANTLFHDGSVHLIKAFSPINGVMTPTSTDPKTTELADWMILAPGNLKPTATYFGTTQGKPENVWTKGRPLPF
jgi:prepilin-type processing-associated H-X9-DG protein